MDKAVREAGMVALDALDRYQFENTAGKVEAIRALVAAQAVELTELKTARAAAADLDHDGRRDDAEFWWTVAAFRGREMATAIDRAEAAESALAQAVVERDGVRELLAGCRVVLDGLRTVSGTNGEKKYDCAESRGGSLVNVASVIKRIDELLAARAAGWREGVA